MSRRSGAAPSANGLGIGRTVLLLLLAGVHVRMRVRDCEIGREQNRVSE